MSETSALYEPSIKDPEVVVTEFQPHHGTHRSDFLETPVDEHEEIKPISWDGLEDPKNPQNWPGSRKWLVMSVNSIITVNV